MNPLPVTRAKRFFFRFNAGDLNGAKRDLAAILAPLVAQTQAASAIVYRAEEIRGEEEFRAVAARALAAPRIPELGVTLGDEATSVLRRSRVPFQTSSPGDERFANLPEVLQYGIRQLLIFPLRAGDLLLGFMTLGGAGTEPFGAHVVESAGSVARVAAAVLERDALQTALKERKLVERAKGLLQQRRRISEEDAYLFLRSQSRRARRPMVEIAGEIIGELALRTA